MEGKKGRNSARGRIKTAKSDWRKTKKREIWFFIKDSLCFSLNAVNKEIESGGNEKSDICQWLMFLQEDGNKDLFHSCSLGTDIVLWHAQDRNIVMIDIWAKKENGIHYYICHLPLAGGGFFFKISFERIKWKLPLLQSDWLMSVFTFLFKPVVLKKNVVARVKWLQRGWKLNKKKDRKRRRWWKRKRSNK